MSNKPILAGVAIAALGIIAAVAISAHYVVARTDNAQTQPVAPVPAATTAMVPAPAATAAPAMAQQEAAPPPAPAVDQYARVVEVKPIRETSTTEHPRQVCQDVQVVHQEPYKDKHQIGGSAVGAVVGGLLGNQIGGGKGKTLATVGGAVAGGVAGHEIQKKHQENNATYTTTENQCHTVVDKSTNSRTVGYDVTYQYNGQEGHVRMSHDPGVGNGLPISMTANGPVVTNQ